MKLLPPPSKMPVQRIPEPTAVEDAMMVQFHFGTHGSADSYSQVAYTTVGDWSCNAFKKRLWKIRGLLHYRGVYFTETIGRLNIKEYRKMTEEQKTNRKKSKLYGEMQRRAAAIRERNGLFINEELQQLQQEYENALKTLNR